ncbi:radical SAM protein [Bosea sp. RAC05]|uniref:radical SAM protein n=1 Tax=Bosea sp. RAC05 TaxID=1842539 RepID=UPI000855F6F8|nr:radical SAM protein [Bosea sp. RAC05]AOG03709.1 radical SAM superfamily protein [Bosea sp. RAC05]
MNAPTLMPAKFVDPVLTARGERRASVALKGLETLWFNTGTLCNITCQNCYIESSPSNDRLVYLSQADVTTYLDEVRVERLPVRMIGFTGGEPFMNRDMIAILTETLERGFETLVLTNAMRPMMRRQEQLRRLREAHGGLLRFRVSLDSHHATVHDAERGAGSFAKAMEGLRFLSREGFQVEIAGRHLDAEPETVARAGYRALFDREAIAVDCDDPVQLVIFPEMTPDGNPPEITEACWGILDKSPDDVMCATSRMVVRRKGAEAPAVVACTLIAYDERFELGRTLKQAAVPVPLNHRHCATFCVLGGAACGVKKS